MGRNLGSFADNDALNRPDLNLCPDCGCYFASERCPLCGKECPEAFRAGNRAKVKQKKKYWQRSEQTPAFISWYHRWFFIILFFILSPIVGIVLLVTSPHKRAQKMLVGGICVGLAVLPVILSFLIPLFSVLFGNHGPLVDTSLSREEYIAACRTVSAEELYRDADNMKEEFVSLTLTVESSFSSVDDNPYDKKARDTYYVCHDGSGREFRILLLDCIQDTPRNFIAGDVITVYGEVAGTVTAYDDEQYDAHTAPCLYVAYVA